MSLVHLLHVWTKESSDFMGEPPEIPRCPTPQEEAKIVRYAIRKGMIEHARIGQRYFTYERWVCSSNQNVVLMAVQNFLRYEGLCYNARLGDYNADDDLDTIEQEMGHLIVNVSWVMSGMCQTCGKVHNS